MNSKLHYKIEKINFNFFTNFLLTWINKPAKDNERGYTVLDATPTVLRLIGAYDTSFESSKLPTIQIYMYHQITYVILKLGAVILLVTCSSLKSQHIDHNHLYYAYFVSAFPKHHF